MWNSDTHWLKETNTLFSEGVRNHDEMQRSRSCRKEERNSGWKETGRSSMEGRNRYISMPVNY